MKISRQNVNFSEKKQLIPFKLVLELRWRLFLLIITEIKTISNNRVSVFYSSLRNSSLVGSKFRRKKGGPRNALKIGSEERRVFDRDLMKNQIGDLSVFPID